MPDYMPSKNSLGIDRMDEMEERRNNRTTPECNLRSNYSRIDTPSSLSIVRYTC